MVGAWFALVGAGLGVWMTSTGAVTLTPALIGVAGIAAWLALRQSIITYRDMLNPLVLLTVLVLVRMSLPALVLSLTGYDIRDFPVFGQMGLRREDWLAGHALALTGLCGLLLGWMAVRDRAPGHTRATSYEGPVIIPALAFLVGLASLLLFVSSNASLSESVSSGAFRGVVVQEGTGKLFYLGLALIPSSVLLSTVLLTLDVPRLVAAAPVVVAAAGYFVLGGRMRAAVPLVVFGLVAWYRVREQQSWRRTHLGSALIWAASAGLVLLAIAAAGQAYRGGGGLQGIASALSLSSVSAYLREAVIVDLGQLHALAGITRLDPGIYSGANFIHAGLWPLSDFAHLPSPSGGVLILRQLVGLSGRSWGFHPTLFGDTYLNLGVLAVPAVALGAGALVKVSYQRFRVGRMTAVAYALSLVYAYRVLLESVTKWPEFVVVVSVYIVIGTAGRWTSRSAGAQPSASAHQHALGGGSRGHR